MSEIIIKFDGKVTKGVITCGFLIFKDGKLVHVGLERGKNLPATKTMARWLSAVLSITKVLEHLENVDSIFIQGTPNSLIKQMSGDWKCQTKEAEPFKQAIQDLIKLLELTFKIQTSFESLG